MSKTEINSDQLKIARSANKVYEFLTDLRNYQNLLPEDETRDVEADVDKASLSVKGLGHFSIEVTNKSPESFIELTPSSKLPFPFTIEWHIEDKGEESVVTGKIQAELNMFMKMMAEPKLRSFVDKQAHKLKNYLESEIS